MYEWHEKYSVNIDYIDDEHKQLLKIGEEIQKLLKDKEENSYNQIVILLEKLKDYTQYHFSSEEGLMNKYNYAEIEGHKKEHVKFVNKLSAIDLQAIKVSNKEKVIALLVFINDWIINHIEGTDAKYSEFLVDAIAKSKKKK